MATDIQSVRTRRDISEKEMEELRFHFCRALSKYSSKDKHFITTTWKSLREHHNEVLYHNLTLAYHDLNKARGLSMEIPDTVIVAVVFRYLKFHPTANGATNADKRSKYVKFALGDIFGWKQLDIDEVIKALCVSDNLSVPSSNSPYHQN